MLDVVDVPLTNALTVGPEHQTVDRLAFPHVVLGQVQLDLATKLRVLCLRRVWNTVWAERRVSLPNMARLGKEKAKNHSTQDSRVVPHRGTNWAALWLTSQIGRDAVLSKSYGRG